MKTTLIFFKEKKRRKKEKEGRKGGEGGSGRRGREREKGKSVSRPLPGSILILYVWSGTKKADFLPD